MHLSSGQLKVVLILALLQELQVKRQRDVFQELFEKDLQLCPQCFVEQREQCQDIFQKISEPSDWSRLLKAVSLLIDRRTIYFLELNDVHQEAKLVAKRKAIEDQKHKTENPKKEFLELKERPGGFHLCRSLTGKPRFVNYLEQRGHSSASVWLYMMHYVSPLLMQELYIQGFPVPRTYASCGFTHFQSYAGHTLMYYAEAEEGLRLDLARQLLQLSLKLTFGFSDFRIYLTDLTADNLAYDKENKKLIIIDLDSVVLVDAASTSGQAQKYEPLPGDGFTFDVSAFCSGQQLDANVYQACLLLRDFLLKDVVNERLQHLLEQCVTCKDELCDMRFQKAYDLIKLMDS
ncbi:divergent protein kinase domain 2A [Drosophila eugracilis]|uniref:divergent protein kinase domain 2A n=1 Tax=Drosophila eugracilis TaxID=29029 RepID=UPI001BDB393D|nr:divergent protein kinase domain 2A [Drosophila eugracilis]XP_017077215.2 divergent protein kinase domain 2A [Drosophila eugracilis]XP_017077216.2 divergent protein kinase domain 2A [Drosophila eugracilis]